jgi:hypothetical protein
LTEYEGPEVIMQDLREDGSTSLAYPDNANKHTEQSLKKLDLEYGRTWKEGAIQSFFFIDW